VSILGLWVLGLYVASLSVSLGAFSGTARILQIMGRDIFTGRMKLLAAVVRV